MIGKNFLSGGSVRALLVAVATVCACASTAKAAISLTEASPSYSYLTNATSDPNATFTGDVQSDPAGQYSFNNSPVGTITYVFDLAPNANNLNLTGASLFANAFPDAGYVTGPTNGISLTYSVAGGGSGTLFNLLTQGFPAATVQIPSFSENISLTPANSDTVVTVTFSSFSTTGNNFQEQMLRNTQPFVATATFQATPEPSSFVLWGLGAAGVLLTSHCRRRLA